MYQENPEMEGDWVERSYQLFNQHGFTVFPEQQVIYGNLASRLLGRNIIEAGCGIGTGTALLATRNSIIGTDKSDKQVRYAQNLYPWVPFKVWDIVDNPAETYEVVIALEVIEHIKEYKRAIKNLLASGSEIYISTPNRNNQELKGDRPKNRLHVREFTPSEMIEMLGGGEILHWQTFEKLNEETEVSPLVYWLRA